MKDKLRSFAEEFIPLEGLSFYMAGFALGTEFAEWASDNDWNYDGEKWFNVIWNRDSDGEVCSSEQVFKTTPELTELFLESKMKEK